MNIFYLSEDIDECVKYHCDKHVVKMLLEYAQILSTSHQILAERRNILLYKPTHKNHPCSIWAREGSKNYEYLYTLWAALHKEYKFRYGREHKSFVTLQHHLSHLPKNIKLTEEMTQLPQCMPEQYHCDDSVEAYRAYYKNEKKDICKWKGRETPNFMR